MAIITNDDWWRRQPNDDWWRLQQMELEQLYRERLERLERERREMSARVYGPDPRTYKKPEYEVWRPVVPEPPPGVGPAPIPDVQLSPREKPWVNRTQRLAEEMFEEWRDD